MASQAASTSSVALNTAALLQLPGLELVAYLASVAAAIITVITRTRGPLGIWFVLFLLYSTVARMSLDQARDMAFYYSVVSAWPPSTFYFGREAIFWYGTAGLYLLTNNEVLTFLITDVFVAFIVLHAMRMFDSGDRRMISLTPMLMCSFVFLLGQQNAYRQHLAVALLLLALSARYRRSRMSVPLLLCAVLTHNMVAVFGGVWLDSRYSQKTRYGRLITFAGAISIGLLLPVIGKSASFTGLDLRLLYVGVVGAIAILLWYFELGRFGSVFPTSLTHYISFLPALLFLSSAQFERLSMVFLVVIVVELHLSGSWCAIRESTLSVLGCLLLVVPVFLFGSTLRILV